MLKKLVEEHKFFRRLVLVWSISLITYTVVEAIDKFGKLTSSDATVCAATIGILSVAIAFYQWSRNAEGK